MYLQHILRIGKDCTAGAILLLVLSPVGLCQTVSDAEANPGRSDTIDEITVYGAKSLRNLRLDVYTAEENVYGVFNSLNSDDKFDIHCYREAPTGSHIKRRVCRANYVSKATAEEARAMILGVGYVPAIVKIRQNDKLLQKEMEALVVKQPELFSALTKFSDAKQILGSEKKRRCEGRIILCRK